MRRSLLVSTGLIAFLVSGSAQAVKRKGPKAMRPAVAAHASRDHQRFVGGGTGGDSPKPEGGSPPELLFTFDDGPHLANTPKVLDLLDEHGIKAVFFVCGVHFQGKSIAADKGRALLREEVKRGHLVGNHTIHHLFLCSATNAPKVVDEVEGNGKLIAEALGEPPYLFRTPYGAHCPTLAATLKNLNIRPIGWDIDPQDWRLKNAAKIEATVKASFRRLQGRNILLLHDVQSATLAALPHILDDLDAENVRRKKAGEPEITVLGPEYLLEGKASSTPLVDEFVRVTGEAITAALTRIGAPVPKLSAPPDAGTDR